MYDRVNTEKQYFHIFHIFFFLPSNCYTNTAICYFLLQDNNISFTEVYLKNLTFS